jgi:hypothetical protein
MEVIEAVRDEVAVRLPSRHRFPHAFTHIFAGSYASKLLQLSLGRVCTRRRGSSVLPRRDDQSHQRRSSATKSRRAAPVARRRKAFARSGGVMLTEAADPAWAGSKPMTPPHAARYAPACRSRFHRFRERMRETVPDIQKPSEDALTPERAAAFALIALGHVTREYPHKPDVLTGDTTYRLREVHPVSSAASTGTVASTATGC